MALVLFATPFIYINLIFGNVDWLVLLGATLQPLIGVWFVMVKPQIGIWVVLVWAWRYVHGHEYGKLFWLLAPVTLALAVQVAVFGLPRVGGIASVAQIWPWGVPIGLWLLVGALKKNDVRAALASGLFLSPFVNITSWIAIAPWLAGQSRRVIVIGSILAWAGLAVWIARGK